MAEYDDEDNFSEDESDDESMSEEDSSDFDGEDDLSEEGMSWDELDKQAEEDDKRAALKRAGDGREKSGKPRPIQNGKRR